MKVRNGKAMAIASVAAILASVAAMPTSAAELNKYTAAYETLTSSITTDDGNVIPAGSVAVTLSIGGNTGFDSNTVTLGISDGYTVLTDSTGKPIVQKEALLTDSLASAAVSADGSTVCVASAAGSTCEENGELFTVYATVDADNPNAGFVTVNSVEAECIDEITFTNQSADAEPLTIIRNSKIYYYGGDANNDNKVNSIDAALIRNVLSKTPTGELYVPTIKADDSYLDYFETVVFAEQPDADGNNYINDDDASVILEYAACAGVGLAYTGSGSQTVGVLIEGTY